MPNPSPNLFQASRDYFMNLYYSRNDFWAVNKKILNRNEYQI